MLTSHRYLEERHNFVEALPLTDLALEIADAHEKDIPTVLADILFAKSSSSAGINQPERCLQFAERHFDQRLKAEELENPGKKGIYYGIAYTQHAEGLILNGYYDKAIEQSDIAELILKTTPEFFNRSYWPHYVVYHRAWSHIGLGQPQMAQEEVEELLAWRLQRFGEDEVDPYRTAYAQHLLGRIREELGDGDASFAWYQKSLKSYTASVGDSHYRTNQVRIKLAERHAALGQVEAASIYFDTAIKYFQMQPFWAQETARALFKKAQFLQSIQNGRDADVAFEQAAEKYRQVTGSRPRDAKSLSEVDYDAVCAIWSR